MEVPLVFVSPKVWASDMLCWNISLAAVLRAVWASASGVVGCLPRARHLRILSRMHSSFVVGLVGLESSGARDLTRARCLGGFEDLALEG